MKKRYKITILLFILFIISSILLYRFKMYKSNTYKLIEVGVYQEENQYFLNGDTLVEIAPDGHVKEYDEERIVKEYESDIIFIENYENKQLIIHKDVSI